MGEPKMEQLTTGEMIAALKPSRTPWVLFVLASLAGLGGAAYLFMQGQRARSELEVVRASLEAAKAERTDFAQRLEKMEAEKADLLALRNELSLQVQAKDEELAKLQGTYQELEAKMKEEIAKGDIRLSQSGGRIKVDLVDKILFDVGNADISKGGGEVLSRVGGVLANVQDKKIQVSGHTDDLPIHERLRDRYPTNWELASARATNVVRYLEEQAKVPGARLVAAAYGPYEPISSNKSASGRARNRRIEIVLTPALAPAAIDGPARPAAAAEPAKAAAKPAAKAPAKKAVAPAKKKRRP
jgi:chemotaxis protein MotB